LKIKLKGCHFFITEVIERSESQTLSQKVAEALGMVICMEGDYFEGDGGQEVQS
jgi:hypothetical protein